MLPHYLRPTARIYLSFSPLSVFSTSSGRTFPRFFSSLVSSLLFLFCCFGAGASPVARAATINVAQGADLQAALQAAQPGDVIVLQAGASYHGSFKLPRKTGDEWITVRTSAPDTALPPAGERVTPAYQKALAALVSPGRNLPALYTAAGAHHFKFIGIDFSTRTDDEMTSLVTLGGDEKTQTNLGQVPHHLIFDRCYFHAFQKQTLRRGLTINSAHTHVLNSYFQGFKSKHQDAQAILGWNGPGPFRIINNYLEGSGENVMFGGADAGIDGLVPSDIEILNNHFYKPLSWRGVWTVKNIFELKFARRVLVEGNIFENCWADAQNGFAINLKVANPSHTPWAVTEDVRFVNNIIRHAGGGISLLGNDYRDPSQGMRRIEISNNLFEDIGAPWGKGIFMSISEGPREVTIAHNTILQTDSVLAFAGDRACPNFNFVDNLVFHNKYGVKGSGLSTGSPSINFYMPAGAFTNNILVGGKRALYPAGNYFPATLAEVDMTDPAHGKYKLRPSSSYVAAASDRTAVGCDVPKLERALQVSTGSDEPSEPAGGTSDNPSPSSVPVGKTVVLYAARAAVKVGGWQAVTHQAAADGAYLIHPEAAAGAPAVLKIKAPLAAPSHYFELSFYAQAGRPYHFWLRGRALQDAYANDSVYIQFAGAVDVTGKPLYRIGTTGGSTVILEDGRGAGLSGWGWQDNAWEKVAAPVYFAETGMQTLRVQTREDGFAIDQIVLSPDLYLTTAPGALKQDATILPQADGR